MHHGIRVFAILLVLALVARGTASPEGKPGKSRLELPGYFASTETRSFMPRERSSIVVFGERPDILMGLYVFDPNGNCVAHDDAGDDLAVEWFPPRKQPYTYQVRNLGMKSTPLIMTIR